MATLPDPANATTLDSSTTSATLELFRAVLGPVNTDYYLKAFTRFDAKDRAGPSWNWAAGLLTLNWMALRQLWGIALAYLGAVLAAALLVFGIGRLVFGLSFEAQMAWLVALLALAIAIPGVFGNAWLYNASRKKMEKALAANATLADACAMLRRQAATRQRLIGLGIGNGVLIAGVASLVFSFQGMQDASPTQSPVAAKAPEPIDMAIKAAPVASQPPVVVASGMSVASSAPAASPMAAASAMSVVASAPATPASRVASAPVSSAAASAPVKAVAASAPQTAAEARMPEKVAPAPAKPKAKAEKPSGKEPKDAKEVKAAGASEQKYLVNVGLFADENNARNASAKLEDARIPVLVNEMDTAKGKRTRVRAGPFATQAEAERAADKIQFIGLDAVVVRK
jgi:cell division septation protein DedD